MQRKQEATVAASLKPLSPPPRSVSLSPSSSPGKLSAPDSKDGKDRDSVLQKLSRADRSQTDLQSPASARSARSGRAGRAGGNSDRYKGKSKAERMFYKQQLRLHGLADSQDDDSEAEIVNEGDDGDAAHVDADREVHSSLSRSSHSHSHSRSESPALSIQTEQRSQGHRHVISSDFSGADGVAFVSVVSGRDSPLMDSDPQYRAKIAGAPAAARGNGGQPSRVGNLLSVFGSPTEKDKSGSGSGRLSRTEKIGGPLYDSPSSGGSSSKEKKKRSIFDIVKEALTPTDDKDKEKEKDKPKDKDKDKDKEKDLVGAVKPVDSRAGVLCLFVSSFAFHVPYFCRRIRC